MFSQFNIGVTNNIINQINKFPYWSWSLNCHNAFSAHSNVEHHRTFNTCELESFAVRNKLDVVLISESHTTSRTVMNIHNYLCYLPPCWKFGKAVVVRKCIKDHLLEPYITEHNQATSIKLMDRAGITMLSAVFYLLRHKISEEIFSH